MDNQPVLTVNLGQVAVKSQFRMKFILAVFYSHLAIKGFIPQI